MISYCNDDRFEIIDRAKKHLVKCTNIESQPEEMAVLDNILFRCWQMGWLDQYKMKNDETQIKESSSCVI